MIRTALQMKWLAAVVLTAVAAFVGFGAVTAFATENENTVTVTINKMIDGVAATAISANSASFPMSSTWDAANIGAGSGTYTLNPSGFNSTNPYEAVTSEMTEGADYTTYEMVDSGVVGASCAEEKPFALQGYTWGDTLAEAQAGTPSMTAPVFTDLTTDKYVLVWNVTCGEEVEAATLTIVKHTIGGDGTFNFTVGGATPATTTSLTTTGGAATSSDITLTPGTSMVSELPNEGWTFTDSACIYDNESYGTQVPYGEEIYVEAGDHITCTFTNTMNEIPATSTVQVFITKYLNGQEATMQSASSSVFTMNAAWNDPLGIGAGTGTYDLEASSTPAYQAETIEFNEGADYSTSEVTGTNVGINCAAGKPYAFSGYKTGESMAAAASSTATTTAPAFVNLQSDKYVIVLNVTCTDGMISGDVEGEDGVLAVTSIEATDTSATADNSYEHGWEYIFHITLPTDENGLAMKFSDWTGGMNTIPAAGNMRISSAQADNSGATITVLAADTYTVPDLNMVVDLDPMTPGIQVEVVVEVKIPVGTSNATYSTNYGVRSQ